MSTKLKTALAMTASCVALVCSDIRFEAAAHGVHRPRLGASHTTPSGAPETWGTYCITELAPLFREAIQLAQANQATPSSDAAPATTAKSQPSGALNIKPPTPAPVKSSASAASSIPLLKPLPPSLSAKPQEPTDKITIYVARKIVTMDPGWPEATAVAVKDGRILSVGSLDDLQPWMKRYPYEIDKRFAKQVIYPGFVEAHGHPVMGAVAISLPPLSYFPLRNPYGPDFPGVKTREAAMQALAKYVKAAKPGETVLTWGYDVVAMGGNLLTRADLDAVSKTQPIVVWDASEHYVFANSAAIQKYGITNDLVAKTIGAGKNADGSSNGQFLGTEAAKVIILKPLSEILTPEEGRKRLRYLGALMQQAGITATGDLFYGGVNLQLEDMLTKDYFGQPNSIARIVHVADGATFQQLYGDSAVEEVTKLRYTSNERQIFNGVKFYADDAFVSFGMELQYPGYIDNDRFKGLFMYTSKDAFLDAMRPWWKAGYQIHVHSNGSGGNQITLDALAALQAETPRFDHRFSFEHFGVSSTAQVRQVKALGAVISTNPYYVSERADLNADYLGTDRASLAARMNTIVKENIVLSLHSDTPVGVPSPLYEVWTAVNRIGELSGKTHAPAERVRNVERAMRMVTIDAAYTLGVNDRIGSIEAGKYADFVVLDKDPQEVSAKTIKDIKVMATITGGNAMLTSQTRNPNW